MAEAGIRTLKDGVVQIALITIGVVIGLWFDSLVSSRADRALVREARANLTSEMRDNRKQLDDALQAVEKEREDYSHALDVAELGLARKPIKNEKVSLEVKLADLQTASRTSAEMTGAMALMPYDEVKKYASLYGHQQLFLDVQNEILRGLMHAVSFVPILVEPEKASPHEFEQFRDSLRQAAASLYMAEQLGRGLLNEYDQILAGR